MLILISTLSITALAEDEILVFYNESEIIFDVNPVIIDGRTMVPMRAIFEAFGASVDYNSQTQQITAIKGNLQIILNIGKTNASVTKYGVVNECLLDAVPTIINSRTVVPLRFIGESLGASVLWNGQSRTITITSIKATPVESVSLSTAALNVNVGQEVTITATVLPSDATVKTLVWTSADQNIATVEDGIITGITPGMTTITAEADNGCKDICTVTVTAPVVRVANINLNKSVTSIVAGATETLTAIVLPANATNKAVTWTSSDTNIATVDTTGKVTAVSAGTATITATTVDGNKTVGCIVTVKNPVVNVTSVSLNKTIDTLTVGGTDTLTATVSPANSTNKNVTWTSSNNNIAAVDSAGKVTAVSAGTATIIAVTTDGNKTASCTVTVNNLGDGKAPIVESFNVLSSVKAGENIKISATISDDISGVSSAKVTFQNKGSQRNIHVSLEESGEL